jgi:hypothetical protein
LSVKDQEKGGRQRNNFDRALASVVSYCEDPPEWHSQPPKYILGLSLPATHAYFRWLKSRVRRPLRERLGLWILLLNPIDKESIYAVSPNEEYPESSRYSILPFQM